MKNIILNFLIGSGILTAIGAIIYLIDKHEKTAQLIGAGLFFVVISIAVGAFVKHVVTHWNEDPDDWRD